MTNYTITEEQRDELVSFISTEMSLLPSVSIGKKRYTKAINLLQSLPEQSSEPVAWMMNVNDTPLMSINREWFREDADPIALYAHPRTPMSDNKVLTIANKSIGGLFDEEAITLARAIEKAHGITD